MPAQPKVDRVYYGTIPAMIAEVSACEMEQEWLDRYGFKWAMMPVGEDQFDTEFYPNEEEARANAIALAEELGCPCTGL